MDNSVSANIAQKIGQPVESMGGATGNMVNEPGTLSDSLATATKSLLSYAKLAAQKNPNDPDIKLVRRIIQEISRLVAKDQTEGDSGNPMVPGISGLMGTPMGQGEMTGGGQGIQMPDLTPFTQVKV